ncbi:MAG: M4 family metallopeptidase, partial [Streptomyces sp.]|nr:M4 family metallopeptidase [Streptomyces sp.]
TIGGVAHSSPTCDGSTVTGIGRAKLGAIWYRALTVHMTSSTTYAGARTATLNAARDLYGAGSAERAAVAAAWGAVGVR